MHDGPQNACDNIAIQNDLPQNHRAYLEGKNKIISLVNENVIFDSAFFNAFTIEKLLFKPQVINEKNNTLLWWLAWAVAMGRAEPFELIWLKYSQELSLEDFLIKADTESDMGTSAILWLAYGINHTSRPFNRIWQRWGDQITDTDLQSKAENGPFKNISLINAMIRAAKENKIKRENIHKILATSPSVCNKEDLAVVPSTELSIGEYIQKNIQAGCDWSVKLKRMIDARNAFFEGLENLINTKQMNANILSHIEKLADTAYNEGYMSARYDVDLVIAIIHAANKKEWIVVFNQLESHPQKNCIMNASMYHFLLHAATKQDNFLTIQSLNTFFGKKQYDHNDFALHCQELNYYKDRFKASATFVSHVLIKKGTDNIPLSASQFQFSSVPLEVPSLAKLQSITRSTMHGLDCYEASTEDNQKMISTDVFNIELKTQVEGIFILQNYDLVFLIPKNGTYFAQETIEIFKPNTTIFENITQVDKENIEEECPVVRGGERDIKLIDIHMRRSYPEKKQLKERDQDGVNSVIPGKTIAAYQAFAHFYQTFFTDNMLQTVGKSLENKWLFTPEILHAIGKQFFRPAEKHYTANNLAIAPKWVNSLMMVIESALRWIAIQSPSIHLTLKTLFKTFPLHHVLQRGKMEAILKSKNTEVKITKELLPYQKNPPFPRITDIAQTTWVLNSLLNGEVTKPIMLNPLSELPKTITTQFDTIPKENTIEPDTATIAMTKKLDS